MANQRKTYIINPKFQYKFSFIICSLIFIGSLIYPITIYDLFEYIIGLKPSAAMEHETQRNNLIYYLILMQLAFIGLVFIFCLFISHRIAGPIYKLTLYLRDVRESGELLYLKFRDGDNFPELADEINLTMTYLANKTDEEAKTLTDLSHYLENLALVIPEDKKSVLDEAQTKIKKYLSTHEN